MRSRIIVAAYFASCCAVLQSASAQALSLEFHDGRVRLTAENVPVSRILAEWTRVGGTRIVNGERVPGAPRHAATRCSGTAGARDRPSRRCGLHGPGARHDISRARPRSTRFSCSRRRPAHPLPRRRRHQSAQAPQFRDRSAEPIESRKCRRGSAGHRTARRFSARSRTRTPAGPATTGESARAVTDPNPNGRFRCRGRTRRPAPDPNPSRRHRAIRSASCRARADRARSTRRQPRDPNAEQGAAVARRSFSSNRRSPTASHV